jgi:hypothetical protein
MISSKQFNSSQDSTWKAPNISQLQLDIAGRVDALDLVATIVRDGAVEDLR